MKKGYRISLGAAVLALLVLVLAALGRRSDEVRLRTACNGLEVRILDSTLLAFVSKEDVARTIARDYGTFLGQRIDSVDLWRIETALRGRSAIRQAEAYITRDGILHVDILQREPSVRFQKADCGFYADESAFIFPLHPDYSSDALVVEGDIPLAVDGQFRGYLQDPAQRRWLEGVVALVRFTGDHKEWNGALKSIRVEPGGNLVLYPSKGGERFLFGQPDALKDKFARMEEYYRIIAPAREEGWYRSVDVRYNGQIICKRK